MMQATIQKNDGTAKGLIFTASAVVFIAVVILSKVKLEVDLGFNVHVFATINAVINSMVSVLLIAGLVAIKRGNQLLHRNIMFSAMALSVLFLLSYIAHHLLSGDTKFGGEGTIRYVYFFILITHIFLAAVILPFILFTAYIIFSVFTDSENAGNLKINIIHKNSINRTMTLEQLME